MLKNWSSGGLTRAPARGNHTPSQHTKGERWQDQQGNWVWWPIHQPAQTPLPPHHRHGLWREIGVKTAEAIGCGGHGHLRPQPHPLPPLNRISTTKLPTGASSSGQRPRETHPSDVLQLSAGDSARLRLGSPSFMALLTRMVAHPRNYGKVDLRDLQDIIQLVENKDGEEVMVIETQESIPEHCSQMARYILTTITPASQGQGTVQRRKH